MITDFGLARRHGLGEESITNTGESLGTPLYMAPEQVNSGVEPITPATDVYALGIVLYEMVTGEMPFKGSSTTVMALKRIREKPQSPRTLLPDLDVRWETVIMRCLERHGERRYQTAAAVAAALTGPESPEPFDDQAPSRRRGLARSLRPRAQKPAKLERKRSYCFWNVVVWLFRKCDRPPSLAVGNMGR